MKVWPVMFVTLLLMAIPFSSFGATSKVDCSLQSYTELIACVQSRSSQVLISDQQLKSAQKREDIASQFLNPELEAESTLSGAERSETSASLLFNIRLGGKKDALLSEARSEIEIASGNRDLGVSQSRLELMLSLYRLSHLKSEIALKEEAVQTFAKIINQFQKRPALSPEQDVSLSVFRMAHADDTLNLTKLKSDEEKLYQMFTAVTGIEKADIVRNLPPLKQNWPTIVTRAAVEESPQVRVALGELKLARSQLSLAEAEGIPDLKVGPVVKIAKEDGETLNFFGVGLSMPLPVFNRNGATRAYTSQKVIEAEMSAELAKRKITTTRNELENRYKQTTQSLKNSLSLSTLDRSHKQLERQFFKGIVPSALVIEAHRQVFDLTERRNASELEALESLGQILIIDNKFSEVIL